MTRGRLPGSLRSNASGLSGRACSAAWREAVSFDSLRAALEEALPIEVRTKRASSLRAFFIVYTLGPSFTAIRYVFVHGHKN